MHFYATFLYPSAIGDDDSIYPKTKSGYAFEPDMNNEIFDKLSNKLLHKIAQF